MTAPTYRALRRFHDRVAAMLDDPACGGDLLAVGIAMARWLDIDRDNGVQGTWVKFAAEALALRHPKVTVEGDSGGQLVPVMEAGGLSHTDGRHLRRVLTDDIRRYDMTKDPESKNSSWSRKCAAPMIRREGPCGRSASRTTIVSDRLTGRQQFIGTCTNDRHIAWFEDIIRRNKGAVDEIRPMANAGGVLARHLSEIDWHKIYRYYDRNWTPPPEQNPWQPPQLTVHVGGSMPGADNTADTRQDRPALAVVAGAGERIKVDGDAS